MFLNGFVSVRSISQKQKKGSTSVCMDSGNWKWTEADVHIPARATTVTHHGQEAGGESSWRRAIQHTERQRPWLTNSKMHFFPHRLTWNLGCTPWQTASYDAAGEAGTTTHPPLARTRSHIQHASSKGCEMLIDGLGEHPRNKERALPVPRNQLGGTETGGKLGSQENFPGKSKAGKPRSCRATTEELRTEGSWYLHRCLLGNVASPEADAEENRHRHPRHRK